MVALVVVSASLFEQVHRNKRQHDQEKRDRDQPSCGFEKGEARAAVIATAAVFAGADHKRRALFARFQARGRPVTAGRAVVRGEVALAAAAGAL